MKFASIGPLIENLDFNQFPSEWVHGNLVITPEIPIYHTSGYIVGINISPEEMLNKPRKQVQNEIINAACFLQDNFNVEVIQLGGFTTSVTDGGKVFLHQNNYHGYITHGDSYTAAVTCQSVDKILSMQQRNPEELNLAIVGAYGIIGEAVSKLLISQFQHTYLIGRRMEKLLELQDNIDVSRTEISTDLITKNADVIITATNHPTALLNSDHLKENAIVIDVSQPPNVSPKLCKDRPDILRIDGGYVNFPFDTHIPFMEKGKIFACIAECIMHALENDRNHHIGSIDIDFLKTTEKWAKNYEFTLDELTQFGHPIKI